jgi:hypothetical protein
VQPERRVWVLPVVLALLVLSIPAQVRFTSQVAEPYPGLFQPDFSGDEQRKDQTVRFTIVRLSVDGRPIEPSDLLPDVEDRSEVLTSAFPLDGGEPHVDDALRRTMRSAAARHFADPSELAVTWERRRFHLDTVTYTKGKTRSSYRVDLRGDTP